MGQSRHARIAVALVAVLTASVALLGMSGCVGSAPPHRTPTPTVHKLPTKAELTERLVVQDEVSQHGWGLSADQGTDDDSNFDGDSVCAGAGISGVPDKGVPEVNRIFERATGEQFQETIDAVQDAPKFVKRLKQEFQKCTTASATLDGQPVQLTYTPMDLGEFADISFGFNLRVDAGGEGTAYLNVFTAAQGTAAVRLIWGTATQPLPDTEMAALAKIATRKLFVS